MPRRGGHRRSWRSASSSSSSSETASLSESSDDRHGWQRPPAPGMLEGRKSAADLRQQRHAATTTATTGLRRKVSSASTSDDGSDSDSSEAWSPQRRVLIGYVPKNADVVPAVAFAMGAVDRGDVRGSSSGSSTSESESDSVSNAASPQRFRPGQPQHVRRSQSTDSSSRSSTNTSASSLTARDTTDSSSDGPTDPQRLQQVRALADASARASASPRTRLPTAADFSSASSRDSDSRAKSDDARGSERVSALRRIGTRQSGGPFRLPRASESGPLTRASGPGSHGDQQPLHAAVLESLNRARARSECGSDSDSSGSSRGGASMARLMALRRLVPAKVDVAAGSPARQAPDARRTRPRSPSTSGATDSSEASTVTVPSVAEGDSSAAPSAKALRLEGHSPLANVRGSGSGRRSILQSPQHRASQHHVHFADGTAPAHAAAAAEADNHDDDREQTPLGTAVIITDDPAAGDAAAAAIPSGRSTATTAGSALSAFEAAYRLEQEEHRLTYTARQLQQQQARASGATDDVVVSARTTMTLPSSRPSSAVTEPTTDAELTAWVRLEADHLDRCIAEEVAAHASWSQDTEESIKALEREAADLAEMLQAGRRDGHTAIQHIGRARVVCQKLTAADHAAPATPRH